MGNSPTPNPKMQPVHEVRLGTIKAAIWANEVEGGTRYNVTFERLYRDQDTWKHSASFGRDDLLVLAKVADQAHSWICETRGTGSQETDAVGFASATLPTRPGSGTPLR